MKNCSELEIFSVFRLKMAACQLIGLRSNCFVTASPNKIEWKEVYCHSRSQQDRMEGERERISFTDSREYKGRTFYLNIFQNKRIKANTVFKKIKRQCEKFLKSTQFLNIPQESVILVGSCEDSKTRIHSQSA